MAVEREALDADRAELMRRRRDADVTGSAATLWWATMLTGIVWLGLCLVAGYLQRHGVHESNNLELAAVYFLSFVATGIGLWVLRDRVLVNAATRKLNLLLTFALLAYSVVYLLADLAGMSLHQGMVMMMAVATAAWVVAATTMDRRAYPMIVADTVAVAMLLWWPTYGFEIRGAAVGLGLSVTSMRWLPAADTSAVR